MSKFNDFYQKISSDESVSAEIKQIFKDNGIAEGVNFTELNDGVINTIIPVAKKAGFDFTLEEVKAYFKKSSGDTLSDDELESVAGGKGGGEFCVILGAGAL